MKNIRTTPISMQFTWLLRVRLAAMLAVTVIAAAGRGLVADEPVQPNIVFIFVDDHAFQAISAFGSRINETPHIDRLAHEGMLMRKSFCANSICGPSRATVQTGKHSHRNGVIRNDVKFDTTQVLFSRLLQDAGYQTALIGKWHLQAKPTGFDYWETLPDQGHYYNPDFIQMDGSTRRFEGYCTDIITDKSIEWLESGRDSSKPFMLMCQHKAPHRNWSPAERHFKRYQDQDIPLPETFNDDYSGRSGLLAENEMTIERHFFWGHDMKFHGKNLFPEHFLDGLPNGEYARMTDAQREAWDAHYEPENAAFIEQMKRGELTAEQVTQWKYQRYIKDYLRCVAAVDENVGRMLDYLDQSGLADNTVVFYVSDQGFYLGEHGWYDKRWMFEESLRMPLIVRWPGKIPAGSASDALVQNIDYAPTFLEIAGLPVPDEMQGRSMLPVLTTGQTPEGWRDAIYYAYYENAASHRVAVHDGIRTDRYKLMRYSRTGEWNLFDLESDPQELTSRHADPQYAAVLNGMRRRYHDLRKYYQVNSAVIPETRNDEGWWRERNAKANAEARRGDVDLVFIGDSITQGWEGGGAEAWKEYYANRRALNLGFSGDRTQHVIWRLENGNLEGIEPKAFVVMIGTNNTGHLMQPAEEVAAGIERIVGILRERFPEAKVMLLGVFPRGQQPLDEARLNNMAINQRIRHLDDGQHVIYRDIGATFLEPDGTISKEVMPDALHLTPQAYQRWAAAIEPTLKAWGL